VTYRDDLETRRARVGRLATELAELREQEALVRSLARPRTRLQRWNGGCAIDHELSLSYLPTDAEIVALAHEILGVRGILSVESDARRTWRPGVEEAPRDVSIEFEREEDGTRVRIRATSGVAVPWWMSLAGVPIGLWSPIEWIFATLPAAALGLWLLTRAMTRRRALKLASELAALAMRLRAPEVSRIRPIAMRVSDLDADDPVEETIEEAAARAR
jgi:hypothetical protein